MKLLTLRDHLEYPSLPCHHGSSITHTSEKPSSQASSRWHAEHTNSWHNPFNRLQRSYERREDVIDAYFDLTDAIITERSLIRKARTLYRWNTRPAHHP